MDSFPKIFGRIELKEKNYSKSLFLGCFSLLCNPFPQKVSPKGLQQGLGYELLFPDNGTQKMENKSFGAPKVKLNNENIKPRCL